MKSTKYLILSLLIFSLILNACVSDSQQNDQEQDSIVVIDSTSIIDTASSVDLTSPALPYVVVFNEETARFSIIENPDDPGFKPNGAGYVEVLNTKYPEINIRMGDRRLDTLDVFIDDATHLTQGMGSAGANTYLAEATYAFSELDSVDVVNFIFKTGDHATSGPYTREFFNDFH